MTHTITINAQWNVEVTIENGWVTVKTNYYGTSRTYCYAGIDEAINGSCIVPLVTYLKSL